jgi:hypothetical protein
VHWSGVQGLTPASSSSECRSSGLFRGPPSYDLAHSEDALHFILPPHLSSLVLRTTWSLLAPSELPSTPSTTSSIKWVNPPPSGLSPDDPLLTIHLPPSSGLPKQITWHRKGDYMASVCMCSSLLSQKWTCRVDYELTVAGSGEGQGVWIHQITRRHSQAPFKKTRGAIQAVSFHPTKPQFFVAVSYVCAAFLIRLTKPLAFVRPFSRRSDTYEFTTSLSRSCSRPYFLAFGGSPQWTCIHPAIISSSVDTTANCAGSI